MKRILSVAIVLLLLQICLIAFTNIHKTSFAPFAPNVTLVDFAKDDVDSIAITDAKGATMTLKKADGKWMIDGDRKVPAMASRVDALLTTLADAKRGLAVATTPDAFARFGVAEDAPTHHVVLKAGDRVAADIYFGTSSGYKQLHVRTAGSNDVVTVGLSDNDISVQTTDWIDRDLVSFDVTKAKTIQIGVGESAGAGDTVVLHHLDGKEWAADSAAGQGVKSEQAADLADTVAGLKIFDVAGVAPAAPAEEKTAGKAADDTKEAEPQTPLHIAVEMADGSRTTLDLTPQDEKALVAKWSGLDSELLLSKWQVDDLRKLIGKIQNPEKAEAAESAADVKGEGNASSLPDTGAVSPLAPVE